MASTPSFDDLLQCSICLERFTQPKVLPCQHTFCLSCLKGIIKDAKTVDCPTCRRTHQVPEQGPAGFHDNLVIIGFLDMVGHSTECSDCGKKQILSECEHCKHHVCADCRVSHNRLELEITILILSIQNNLQTSDTSVESAKSNLEINRQAQNNVDENFRIAVAALTDRRNGIIRQLETIAKFDTAIVEGKLDSVIEKTREELSNCFKTEGLRELKRSLFGVEETMSGRIELEEWTRFGDLEFSGGRLVEVGAGVSGAAAGPSCVAEHPSLRGKLKGQGEGQGRGQLSRFPSGVDYAGKVEAWRLVISKAAAGCEELKPTCAVYSQPDSALYCLSGGKLLRYDHKSGAGAVACSLVRARDMALTESGTLLLIDDRHIVRITAEARSEKAFTFSFSSLPVATNATQICCHGSESLVLDSDGSRLLKFREDGKLTGEIKSEKLVLNEKSRMCVDKEGRIYVTGGVQDITRKNSEESRTTCCNAPKQVTITWANVISILSWKEEICGEVVVDEVRSKDYGIRVTSDWGYANFTPCPRRCRYNEDIRNTRITDEQLIRELAKEESLMSLCVDGDGYLIATVAGRHLVVYDPNHERHVTIEGNLKDPTGVSLTPDGRLVVCDTGNNRIQII